MFDFGIFGSKQTSGVPRPDANDTNDFSVSVSEFSNGNDAYVTSRELTTILSNMATKEYCRDNKDEVKDLINKHLQDVDAHKAIFKSQLTTTQQYIDNTVDQKIKDHISVKANKWSIVWVVLGIIGGGPIWSGIQWLWSYFF